MKSFTKRILCVLVTLTLLCTMCACDVLLGKQTLVGKWEAYVDMTDYMNTVLSKAFGVQDVLNEFSLRLVMEFKKDGTVIASIDEEHMEEMAADFSDNFWDAMMEVYADQLGITVEAAEKRMSESGMTKEILAGQLDLANMFPTPDDVESYWRLEDDLLYIAQDREYLDYAEPIEIEFDGRSCFSIIGGDGLSDILGIDMLELFIPMEFNRI